MRIFDKMFGKIKMFDKTLLALVLGYLGLICIVGGFLWIAFKLHWVVGVIVTGIVCLLVGMSDI